jgi:bifunctional ADP-heptose synthase (sugar kinase/adenylyltransferase)
VYCLSPYVGAGVAVVVTVALAGLLYCRSLNVADACCIGIEVVCVVDFVTCFEEDTPLEILQKCKPDVLVKGAQYGKIIGEEIVPETYRAPMVDGVSTTILLGDKPHLCN